MKAVRAQPNHAVSVAVLGVSTKKLAVIFALDGQGNAPVTGIIGELGEPNCRLRLGGLSSTNPSVTLVNVPFILLRFAVQNVPPRFTESFRLWTVAVYVGPAPLTVTCAGTTPAAF